MRKILLCFSDVKCLSGKRRHRRVSSLDCGKCSSRGAQDGCCESPVPPWGVVWGRCIREGFLEEAQESGVLKDRSLKERKIIPGRGNNMS